MGPTTNIKVGDRELVLDFSKLTWQKARQLMLGAPVSRDEEEMSAAEKRYAELLGMISGLKTEEILAMPFTEFVELDKAIAKAMRDLVAADPS